MWATRFRKERRGGMNPSEDVVFIEAYCTRCHRRISLYRELRFLNYKNNVTAIECPECYTKTIEDFKFNRETDNLTDHATKEN